MCSQVDYPVVESHDSRFSGPQTVQGDFIDHNLPKQENYMPSNHDFLLSCTFLGPADVDPDLNSTVAVFQFL